MTFHVGQRVACVETPWVDYPERWEGWCRLVPNRPTIGSIYTVRALICIMRSGLYLCEIRNPVSQFTFGSWEGAFLDRCFRPVTSIEVFESILEDVSKGCEFAKAEKP